MRVDKFEGLGNVRGARRPTTGSRRSFMAVRVVCPCVGLGERGGRYG